MAYKVNLVWDLISESWILFSHEFILGLSHHPNWVLEKPTFFRHNFKGPWKQGQQLGPLRASVWTLAPRSDRSWCEAQSQTWLKPTGPSQNHIPSIHEIHPLCEYVYIYIYTHTYIICLSNMGKNSQQHLHIYIYIYTHMYTHIYIYTFLQIHKDIQKNDISHDLWDISHNLAVLFLRTDGTAPMVRWDEMELTWLERAVGYRYCGLGYWSKVTQ